MSFDKISVNGQINDAKKAQISLLDKGFLSGQGVFETFRYHEREIFLYPQHMVRLGKSLAALGIEIEPDRQQIRRWIDEICLNIPKNKDGFVRLVVTAGADRPNIIIYLRYTDKFTPTEKPVKIISSVSRMRPEYFDKLGFRIKSLDYLSANIAGQELADAQAGILLSPGGYAAECLTANIFWVKNGQIYTPPLSLGILAGTMRQFVINNLEVREKLAPAEELEQTEEIILSSGASYFVAASSLNAVKKPGVSGSVYQKFVELIS